MMGRDLTMKLSRMEHVKHEKPAYKSLLDFYEKIFIAKEEVYQSLKALPIVFDEQVVQTKFKAGYPVLDKGIVDVDIKALEAFFCKLLQISQDKNSETAGKLTSFIEKENLDVGKTLKEMWNGKTAPQKLKKEEVGDPTLLAFLLTESLKPLYEYLAQNLRDVIDVTLWEKGYCPICGKTPPIAAIPEGKWSRLLFCVYCGTEWSFPFLMCPFCGNEDEEGIRYLYVGNEKQYRIEVCKACQKYLKVVDTAALGSHVFLDIENIVTLHLDILAQKEGYQRGARCPLLI